MVEVTKTAGTTKIHSAGNQKKIVIDVTNIVNGYTLTVPHLSTIEDWNAVATTAAAIGGDYSANVITFVTGATLAGQITIYGR